QTDLFEFIVSNEKVVQSSAGASRLSMSSDCSLLIRNITDDDAGRYDCQLMNGTKSDASVFLFILRSEYSDLYNCVIVTT
uniref:Ig-like domain-containing protein n=1 Tax=Oryzias melastigma TaxID=30732 RepID=A0A3B3DHV2_ORYME